MFLLAVRLAVGTGETVRVYGLEVECTHFVPHPPAHFTFALPAGRGPLVARFSCSGS